jgi:hypothetical protein
MIECMFGSAVTRIDSVELILDKSELNMKWFLFEYIYVKVDLIIKLRLKWIVEAKCYKL